MKKNTLGIIIISIGIVMVIYTGANYITTEKVVDLGPIQINKEKNHFFHWPPILGAIIVISGIIIIIRAQRKT